jgi:hypothetical protein
MARNQQFWLANYLATGSLMVLASVVPPLSVPGVMARTAVKPVQVSQMLSWGGLIKLLTPPRKSGGSRDPNFCWVAMSGLPNETNRVASNNPVIYWNDKTKPHSIGIRAKSDDLLSENPPLWKKRASTTAPGIRQMRYDGPPLEAGVEYELLTYTSQGTPSTSGSLANFQVLSLAEQKDLQAQLKPLSGKDETTLLKRLEVYSKQKLSTDALGELLANRSLSREARQILKDLPTTWCALQEPPKPSESSQPSS